MTKRDKKFSWLLILLMVLQMIVMPAAANAADPAAPTDVRAAAANGGTKIILTWSGMTNLKYNIYRSEDRVNFTRIAVTPFGETSYNDLNLNGDVNYYYYITSVDSQGKESAPSAVVTPYKVQPPTDLKAVINSGQINLSWNAAAGSQVAGYNIYKKTNSGSFVKINPSLITSTGYTDTGLSPNTVYAYQVAAVDTSGIESSERAQTTVITPADSQAPSKPGGLTAAASGLTRINLAWNAATDNFGVTEYLIYRSTDNRNFAKISGTADRYYSDTNGLTLNTTYYYRVSARDAAGNESAFSDVASAKLIIDNEKPTSPQLWAEVESSTRIKLTWSGATDNVGVTGYDLYRAVGSGSFTKLAGPASSPYYDNEVSSDKTYRYYIKSRDGAGNLSNTSNIVSVSTVGDTARTIERGKSGYLEIPGLARLDVPSGTLDRDTTFRMVTGDFDNYSTSGYKTTGQPVRITARAGGSEVTGFDAGLTVTFYYNSSQLSSTEINKLRIYYWDEENDVWAPLPSTVYWSPQKVTAKTDHLSAFALLADTSAPDEPELSNASTSNTRNFTLTGEAEEYNEVEIKLNDRTYYTTATGKGRFSLEVMLDTGTNYIELRSTDAAGNRSSWSDEYKIRCNPTLNFNDIAGHWAEDNIQKALELGIASGYKDNTFRPDRSITRAEFCKFVISALGYSPVNNPQLNFKDRRDIPAWAGGYVARAFEKGIVSGYSDGRFKPAREITREEMASMLVRAMNLQREADEKNNSWLNFRDYRQIQSWARGAVVVAVEKGLIKGYADNTFGPLRKASRAEAVTMLIKMQDKI